MPDPEHSVTLAWRELVTTYLDRHLYETARFFAERAWYDDPCQENVHALAECYYRQGKIKQAYLLLQDAKYLDHQPSKYLLGLACVSLGKLEEAESVLMPRNRFTLPSQLTAENLKDIPGGASGLYLMGKVCKRQQRKEMAIQYFQLALEMDPFLWSSVLELCELGVPLDISELLKSSKSLVVPTSRSSPSRNTRQQRQQQQTTPITSAFPAQSPLDTSRTTAMLEGKYSGAKASEIALRALQPFSLPTPPPSSANQSQLPPNSALPHQGHSTPGSSSVANIDTPSGIVASEISAMSLKIPFSTPGSMPSPISRSMLSQSRFTASHNPSNISSFLASGGGGNQMMMPPAHMRSTLRPNMDTIGEDSVLFMGPEGMSGMAGDASSIMPGSGGTGMRFHHHSNHNNSSVMSLQPRGALFGLPTPENDPNHTGLDSSHDHDDTLGDLRGGSAFGKRRVSFVPNARLSFSEALMDTSTGTTASTSALLSPPVAHISTSTTTKVITAGGQDEDQPSKLLRANTNNNHNYSYNNSNLSVMHTGNVRDNMTRSDSFDSEHHHNVNNSNNSMMHSEGVIVKNLFHSVPGKKVGIIHHHEDAGTGRNDSLFDASYGAHDAQEYAVEDNVAYDLHSDVQRTGQSDDSIPTATKTSKPSASSTTTVNSHPTTTSSQSGHHANANSSSISSPSRRLRVSSAHPPNGTLALQQHQSHILHILCVFSRAHQLLSYYQCLEAIDCLQHDLPSHHYSSGLVCQLLGRAYMEMNEYHAAVVAFKEMLRLEPFRISGVEYLSSALWHLRRDKELSALAQQVLDVDRLAPETWCVMGNCASLQKEPETAIRFFARALQVDAHFTYAYTLSGHEYVTNENMDRAVHAFRQALLCHPRHYNAWYGLGSIYYRQERFEMAEYHFRQARDINPRSSVLDCYLGMALSAQGGGGGSKVEEALEVLQAASERFEKNPQLRFQRAHILMTLERWDEALSELQIVAQLAPKEPPVHALLGQVYQRLGLVQESLLHLNIALDLDPKEANAIKAIMDNFNDMALTL